MLCAFIFAQSFLSFEDPKKVKTHKDKARMFRKVCLSVLVLLPIAYLELLTIPIRRNSDPGTCGKANHGQLIIVKNREKKDTILVCTEDNGVYSWKTTDGSKPPGEFFNPGYDCLDILNKNRKAEDGFYWVDFHDGIPKRVWCDMTTDGGGFMLIGRINGTKTWSVPSADDTVKPFGASQWSSSFGNVPVLDFRVQVATKDDFKYTQAHWSFRFKAKRSLKNLIIVNEGGCPNNSPGLGHIAYVKDLLTKEIVTKEFKCSVFGAYYHPLAKIGWMMMNSCLDRPCPYGFAYYYQIPIQVDYFGSFSFQVPEDYSSTSRDGSTAFYGCYKGKCCACYGPIGGTGRYCAKACHPKNGGTMTENAQAWFWVRSNRPRKVWDKCMEYKEEVENGETIWYKLVGDAQVPTKGRCGKNEALLNGGVVVVPDVVAANKIPPVAGLLAYRKDNEKLSVRKNDSWNVLAEDEKIAKELRNINQILEQLYVNSSCKILKKPNLSNGYYSLGLFKVYCDMSSGWTLVARFSNNDTKNWMLPSANWWYDKMTSSGAIFNPSGNEDMISEAFWKVNGHEIKITRSDDLSHTPLLQTTSNCLQGKTFREKIASYGNFRFRETWAQDQCQGSCVVTYGGGYLSTAGFQLHSCSSNIQSNNHIGFWCDWDHGDGAIIMIGGGGSSCERADHGIGITEQNEARFSDGSLPYHDFGYNADYDQVTSYSLNLWVR